MAECVRERWEPRFEGITGDDREGRSYDAYRPRRSRSVLWRLRLALRFGFGSAVAAFSMPGRNGIGDVGRVSSHAVDLLG
jgi:hypothetical protein